MINELPEKKFEGKKDESYNQKKEQATRRFYFQKHHEIEAWILRISGNIESYKRMLESDLETVADFIVKYAVDLL